MPSAEFCQPNYYYCNWFCVSVSEAVRDARVRQLLLLQTSVNPGRHACNTWGQQEERILRKATLLIEDERCHRISFGPLPLQSGGKVFSGLFYERAEALQDLQAELLALFRVELRCNDVFLPDH